MKRATIFKDKKGYILWPMSKTVSGFYVSTEPKLRVLNDEFNSKLASAFFEVINASTQGVPNPRFNQPIDSNQKTRLRRIFEELQIKSFTELDKKPVLSCDVELNSTTIKFIPRAHDLSMKGRGYTSSVNEPVIINANAGEVEILRSIKDVFSRCE